MKKTDNDYDPQVDNEEINFADLPIYNHECLVQLYEEYVSPYTDILDKIDSMVVITTLFDLLDSYGDCPSISPKGNDEEFIVLKDHYSVLKKVSLVDHSVRVAQNMIEALKRTSYGKTLGIKRQLGKILIAALGHDIGKIPFYAARYNKIGNHIAISVKLLEGYIPDVMPSKKVIIEAVQNHHIKVISKDPNDLANQLRTADQAARAEEAQMVTNDGVCDEFVKQLLQSIEKEERKSLARVDLSWLDWNIFLKKVANQINRPISRKSSALAFTFRDGFIYISTYLIFNTIVEIAGYVGLSDMFSRRNGHFILSVANEIGLKMREKSMIAKSVLEPYTSRNFRLIDKFGRVLLRTRFMPVHSSLFESTLGIAWGEFEERKGNKNAQWLRWISEIRSEKEYGKKAS